MKKKATTTDFNPRQLVQLLAIGLESNRHSCSSEDQTRADLLCAVLSGLLPFEISASCVDRSGAGCGYGQLHTTGGRSLEEILFGGGVAVENVIAIKDCAKGLSACSKGRAERSVYTVIYFAAIASARISCDRKITKLSNEALVKAFEALVDKEWMPARLIKHFIRARDIYAQETGRSITGK